jgi:hypothetical protein
MNATPKTLLATLCLLALSIAGAQAAETKSVEKSKEPAASRPSYVPRAPNDYSVGPVASPPPPSIYNGTTKSLPTQPPTSSPSSSRSGPREGSWAYRAD